MTQLTEQTKSERYVTEKEIIDLLEPVGQSHGYEIVDVDWTTDSGKRVLRVYIDNEKGVNIDDCAKVTGYFEDVVDLESSISGSYLFEVSSPGLNRPLRTKEHFEKALNKKVQVVTFEKINNRKNYKGILKSVENDFVVVHIDNQDFKIEFSQIAKAHIKYEFS